METVLITGGTGMIGKALTEALIERGFHVIIFTRSKATGNQQPVTGNISFANWDIYKQTIDKDAFAKADYIIHLAGAPVAEKRWTKKRKQEIVSSRVDSGKLIVESLKTIPNKIKAVISASAIGWYGADPSIPNKNPFTESDPADEHFLGQTCKQWEAAIEPVSFLNKRLVKLRIGIVLGNEGGAYAEFRKPLKFGFATILGGGKQIISWVHVDDLIRAILFSMENEKMEGVYNLVAPQPVSNKEMILEIAGQRKSKFFIPIHVPSLILKIVLGEMSIEILKSATVSAAKIQQAGFIFQYFDIVSAIQQLARQKNLPD